MIAIILSLTAALLVSSEPQAITAQLEAPVFNLADLVSQSDLVVLGVATGRRELGPASLQRLGRTFSTRVMSTTIAVDVVVKGATSSSNLEVGFALPEEAVMGFAEPDYGSSSLFFLQKTGDVYRFTSVFHASTAAIAGFRPSGSTALDRAANVLEEVIASPTSSRLDKRTAIDRLHLIETPAAIRGLNAAVRSQLDSSLRVYAAMGLLQLGDLAALRFAQRELLDRSSGLTDIMAEQLRYGIANGSWRDNSVTVLAGLLASPDVRDRRAAAEGLFRTQSAKAIAPLATALNDRDVDVRYEVVRALALITGDQPTPTREQFVRSPNQYTGYWTAWASKVERSGRF